MRCSRNLSKPNSALLYLARALHEILTRENILKDPKTKLLILTEHRDTLEYLAGRREGPKRERGGLGECHFFQQA